MMDASTIKILLHGRLNAKWVLEPITGDLEPTFYLIRDTNTTSTLLQEIGMMEMYIIKHQTIVLTQSGN